VNLVIRRNGPGNLGDPPTLTLTLPDGANVVTASGFFHNFVTPAVPEPSTWLMMLVAAAGLAYAGDWRSRRNRTGGAEGRGGWRALQFQGMASAAETLCDRAAGKSRRTSFLKRSRS
jgi:PEP-CTERM motif